MGKMVDLARRRIQEAEGYLMLELPEKALEILQDPNRDWSTMPFEADYLIGRTNQELARYAEAIKAYERALGHRPGHLGLALDMGWCYKRNHQLAQAIDALVRVLPEHPKCALLHYNLACYWTLAGKIGQALESLQKGLTLDPELAELIEEEADFDAIREHQEFQAIIELFRSPPSDEPS